MEKILNLVERVNFAARQTYNIIVLGDVEDVVCAKRWVVKNRGSNVELGYISRDVKSEGTYTISTCQYLAQKLSFNGVSE